MSHKTKPNLCLYCGHFIERAVHPIDEALVPGPDDFSMCIRCGNLLRFNADMTLRKATEADEAELDTQERELINRMRIEHAKLQQQRRDSLEGL